MAIYTTLTFARVLAGVLQASQYVSVESSSLTHHRLYRKNSKYWDIYV